MEAAEEAEMVPEGTEGFCGPAENKAAVFFGAGEPTPVVKAVLGAINWNKVGERYKQAMG